MADLPENPNNRKEEYLADMAGLGAELPTKPNNRKEKYLADIAGAGGPAPDAPWSREEAYLAEISGGVQAAKTAITEKGGTADPSTGIAGLADEIGTISGGGGTSYDYTDPDDIYEKTRPADWLELPDPAENECYILFQVPADYDGDNVSLAITGTSKDYGFVVNGVFTPIPEYHGLTYVPLSVFSHKTSEGYLQLICKITSSIVTQFPEISFGKGQIWRHYVAEMKINMPSITSFTLGTIGTYQYCSQMRYLSFYGTSDNMTVFNLRYSYGLLCVRGLENKGSKITDYSYAFAYCQNLICAPKLDTSNATTLANMYSACLNLRYIPDYDVSKATNLSNFEGSTLLVKLPKLKTSSALTNVSGCFSSSNIVVSDFSGIEDMDLSGVTNMATFIYLPPQSVLKFKSLPSVLSGYNFIQTFGANFKYSDGTEMKPTRIAILKDDEVVTIGGTTGASNFCPSDMSMYVPDSLYDEYVADSKWSTISARIHPLSEMPE